MNPASKRKVSLAIVAVILILAIISAVGYAQHRANVRRSMEIRQCQNHCIEVWGDGSAVELANCLVNCNPEDYP